MQKQNARKGNREEGQSPVSGIPVNSTNVGSPGVISPMEEIARGESVGDGEGIERIGKIPHWVA
jgi:hypothetical protein